MRLIGSFHPHSRYFFGLSSMWYCNQYHLRSSGSPASSSSLALTLNRRSVGNASSARTDAEARHTSTTRSRFPLSIEHSPYGQFDSQPLQTAIPGQVRGGGSPARV